MKNLILPPSELIVNDDGSIYHIRLREEHIADTVILVGDQFRVARISKHFDNIECDIHNREFVTQTGTYKGKRITVMSTGIGTDNIDIAVNELDAAVNINLETRQLKSERRSLDLIRIGTSGGLHPDIPVGTFLLSEFGLGFDGLIYYYNSEMNETEKDLTNAVRNHLALPPEISFPYIVEGSKRLVKLFEDGMTKGITGTATGFYGPQGRRLFLEPRLTDLNDKLQSFSHAGHRITNFEMETSAIYGLGKMMGHSCCTCCAIIANRTTKTYSDNYKAIVDDLIVTVLERLAGAEN